MKITRTAIAAVVEVVLGGAKKATKYLSPDTVVKCTRRHKVDRRARTTEVVLTMGRPNYLERSFIKAAKSAGEPFPIRKTQVKWE